MTISVRNRAATVALLAVVACGKGVSDGARRTCIEEFCVSPPSFSQAALVARFGGTPVDSDSFPMYCYTDSRHGLQVLASVYHGEPKDVLAVMVSNARICADPLAPTETFRELRTSEGLSVGDTRERVVSIYGPPMVEVTAQSDAAILDPFGRVPLDPRIGDKVLRYRSKRSGEPPLFEVYLRDGRVSSLFISAFP